MLKKILITFALPFNPILSPNYEWKTWTYKKTLKLDTRHASKSKNIQTKVHIQKARYIFISLFLPPRS